LATHPNLNPVAITVGMGPSGRETTQFRTSVISDNQIDPALLALSQNTPLPSPTLYVAASGTENVAAHAAVHPTTPHHTATTIQTPKRGPKPSVFNSEKLGVAVAKASVKVVSKKRSWEDAFITVQK
jgi:hypothetical protein